MQGEGLQGGADLSMNAFLLAQQQSVPPQNMMRLQQQQQQAAAQQQQQAAMARQGSTGVWGGSCPLWSARGYMRG